MTLRERAQAYLELASKATPGRWYWGGNLKTKEISLTSTIDGHVSVMEFVRWGMHSAAPAFRVDGIMKAISEDGMVTTRKPHTNDFYVVNHPDAEFISASRTEGVWAAQMLLEALDVLEKIAKLPDTPHFQQASPEQQKGMLVCSDMACQLLEGGGQ